MPNIQPVSLARHGDKRWQRYKSYAFAAGEAVAPLVASEFSKAMLALPIAFLAVEDDFVPMAVLGLATGTNLFITADGRSLMRYVPAVFRSHPFHLVNIDDDRQALCIDEDSELINDGEGELFFGEEGQLSQAVAEVLDFLKQVHASRQATTRICTLLNKHALIQPWPITVQQENGEQRLEGLYRINEAALNALPPEAFLELRDGGALAIAYCQLLSMQNLATLGQLAQSRARAAQAQPPLTTEVTPNLDFLTRDDSFNFDALS